MRHGLTLLEVLLVLGLLVVIASIAGPSIGVTFDSSRLRAAGDLVRTQMAKGRVKAMSTGRTYSFRYQPGGNSYLLEPWYSQDDYLESSAIGSANMGMGTMAATPSAAGQQDITGTVNSTDELPDGITFAGGETDMDMRAATLMQAAPSAQEMDGEWSQPIFFYPDGTSSTARLAILNLRQRHIMLTLRGLTGVVQVSQPRSGELGQ